MVKEDSKGYEIYIKEDVPLNRSDRKAYEKIGIEETDDKKIKEAVKKLKKTDPDVDIKLRDYMCDNFYDIRTFGAVMTTFVKYAQFVSFNTIFYLNHLFHFHRIRNIFSIDMNFIILIFSWIFDIILFHYFYRIKQLICRTIP